jgi:hypothetical protein
MIRPPGNGRAGNGTIVAKTLAFRTLIAENCAAMFEREWRRFNRGTQYERKARRAQNAGQTTGCVFVLLVLGLGGWHIYEISRIVESQSWKKTTGLVVASTSEPGTLASFTTYPQVTYAYSVDKYGYSSKTLHWGSEYRLTHAGAAAEAARYPLGAEVEVYYDPEAPSEAVLDRGVNRHYLFDVLLSLAVVGLAFLVTNVVFAEAAKERMKYDSS